MYIISKLPPFMKAFVQNTKASTAMEYAIIGVMFAVACIGGYRLFTDSLADTWNHVATTVENAGTRPN